ncbi:hypothetical protein C8F04DRAFT_1196956 [Mycena alexandri]|uniref:Uncharacterized protein n=1 Tax=Mycena alexandri TaxID=1745969 RepID=A0AAD6S3I5_9AGAR|nr:hypothetical protein C8F04DRAFT_1196956 [Mycena alexandri]
MNFVIYNKLRPLRVNTVVKILEYLAPLTLDSERRPELHLLLSQPLKTLARRVLHLLDTFARDPSRCPLFFSEIVCTRDVAMDGFGGATARCGPPDVPHRKAMRRETAGILTSSATSASGPSNPAGGAAEGGAGKWDVLSERLRVVAAANNVQKQPKTLPTMFSTLTVIGRSETRLEGPEANIDKFEPEAPPAGQTIYRNLAYRLTVGGCAIRAVEASLRDELRKKSLLPAGLFQRED